MDTRGKAAPGAPGSGARRRRGRRAVALAAAALAAAALGGAVAGPFAGTGHATPKTEVHGASPVVHGGAAEGRGPSGGGPGDGAAHLRGVTWG